MLSKKEEKSFEEGNCLEKSLPDDRFHFVYVIWLLNIYVLKVLEFLFWSVDVISVSIMKTCLFKYIETFTTKNRKFSDNNSDIFHISARNIDCVYSLEPPRPGGSNDYPQSMFFSRNKKNNVYPCKPQFYYIKVEFKVVKII